MFFLRARFVSLSGYKHNQGTLQNQRFAASESLLFKLEARDSKRAEGLVLVHGGIVHRLARMFAL